MDHQHVDILPTDQQSGQDGRSELTWKAEPTNIDFRPSVFMVKHCCIVRAIPFQTTPLQTWIYPNTMTRVGHYIRLWETQGLLTVRRGQQEVFWLNNRIFWQQQASATQQNANIHSTGVQIQGAHAYIATHSTASPMLLRQNLSITWVGQSHQQFIQHTHLCSSQWQNATQTKPNSSLALVDAQRRTWIWAINTCYAQAEVKWCAKCVSYLFFLIPIKNDQPPLTPMNGDWSMHHDPNTCLAFRQDTSSDQHCPKTAWTHLSRAVQWHQHLSNKRNEMAK